MASGVLGHLAASLLLSGRVRLRQRSIWQKLALVAAAAWTVDGIAWLPMVRCLVHMAAGEPLLPPVAMLGLLFAAVLWLLAVCRMREPALATVLELTCELDPEYCLS